MQLPWVSLTEETLLPAGSLGIKMIFFQIPEDLPFDCKVMSFELQVYKNLDILFISDEVGCAHEHAHACVSNTKRVLRFTLLVC